MATRSTIALEFADGTVAQVYCHWDGYLDYNGKILQENYTNPFILRDLIDLGDLSSLGPKIGTKHDFDNPYDLGTPEYTDWTMTKKNMCTFYGRDRGENDVQARYFKNFDEYVAQGQCEEYNYILRQVDGQPVWFVMSDDTADKFITLATAMSLQAWSKVEV